MHLGSCGSWHPKTPMLSGACSASCFETKINEWERLSIFFSIIFFLLCLFLSSGVCDKASPSLASVPHHGRKGFHKRKGQSLLSIPEVKHTSLCLCKPSLQGCVVRSLSPVVLYVSSSSKQEFKERLLQSGVCVCVCSACVCCLRVPC